MTVKRSEESAREGEWEKGSGAEQWAKNQRREEKRKRNEENEKNQKK